MCSGSHLKIKASYEGFSTRNQSNKAYFHIIFGLFIKVNGGFFWLIGWWKGDSLERGKNIKTVFAQLGGSYGVTIEQGL